VWDSNSWREVATLRGHDDIVWVCAWSPDGTRLASASSDKTVIVWNPNTGTKLATLEVGAYTRTLVRGPIPSTEGETEG
jgi:WD40 repeat protein